MQICVDLLFSFFVIICSTPAGVVFPFVPNGYKHANPPDLGTKNAATSRIRLPFTNPGINAGAIDSVFNQFANDHSPSHLWSGNGFS